MKNFLAFSPLKVDMVVFFAAFCQFPFQELVSLGHPRLFEEQQPLNINALNYIRVV